MLPYKVLQFILEDVSNGCFSDMTWEEIPQLWPNIMEAIT